MQLISPYKKFELIHHQKNLINIDTRHDENLYKNKIKQEFDANHKLKD